MRITDDMLQAKPKSNKIDLLDLVPLVLTGGLIGIVSTYIALNWHQLNFLG